MTKVSGFRTIGLTCPNEQCRDTTDVEVKFWYDDTGMIGHSVESLYPIESGVELVFDNKPIVCQSCGHVYTHDELNHQFDNWLVLKGWLY